LMEGKMPLSEEQLVATLRTPPCEKHAVDWGMAVDGVRNYHCRACLQRIADAVLEIAARELCVQCRRGESAAMNVRAFPEWEYAHEYSNGVTYACFASRILKLKSGGGA